MKKVLGANPRTVVVLIASFPYAIGWIEENVPAILHLTHNSQELGNALADVLFGAYNPGRPAGADLAALARPAPAHDGLRSPPRSDLPLLRGRTALPLRPRSDLHDLRVFDGLATSVDRMGPDGSVTVSVTVSNTGGRAGDEVVQLYVRRPARGCERPARAPRLRAREHSRRGDAARHDPAARSGRRVLGLGPPRVGPRAREAGADGRQLVRRRRAHAPPDDRRRTLASEGREARYLSAGRRRLRRGGRPHVQHDAAVRGQARCARRPRPRGSRARRRAPSARRSRAGRSRSRSPGAAEARAARRSGARRGHGRCPASPGGAAGAGGRARGGRECRCPPPGRRTTCT